MPWVWSRGGDASARLASARQEIQSAETAIEASNLILAEQHLCRAVELDSKSAGLYLRLGRVRNQLEKWHEAKGSWEKAAKLDPDDAVVWLGMAESEIALG